MVSERARRFVFVVALVFAIATLWRSTSQLEGTEFSGEWLAGRLLDSSDLAIIVFVLALLLTVWLPQLSACLGLVASMCSVPVLLYFLVPGFFRSIFRSEYSVPMGSPVVWTWGTVLPVLAFLFAAVVASWRLSAFRRS